MKITILGSGCSKCREIYSAVEGVLIEKKISAELSKEEDIIEILKYGMINLPAIVIDGKVVAQGGKPITKKEIE